MGISLNRWLKPSQAEERIMQVTYTELHPQAMHAIRAAANWRTWGRHAAVQYCRNRRVPLRLMVLARQLQVATCHGF